MSTIRSPTGYRHGLRVSNPNPPGVLLRGPAVTGQPVAPRFYEIHIVTLVSCRLQVRPM